MILIENEPSKLAKIVKNLFDTKNEKLPEFNIVLPELTDEQREKLKKSMETLMKNLNERRW